MLKTRFLSILLLSLIVLCLDAAAQTTGKRPVIIIPGVTGSELVNVTTKKSVWFSVRRDKDDDVRLPMTSPILSRNRDNLRVGDIIRSVEVLPVVFDIEVYKTLIDALIKRGYKEADWNKPQAADVFYVFPYDWRRDNVETAHLLVGKMAAAKRTLKRPDLKFDILAHSMGGLIARYAAMYGTRDLPQRGVSKPTWAGAQHINKLMMFGTPNEGAFSSFDALVNGYHIVANRKLPFIDDLRAEDVMTNPAAFQLLPHKNSARFLDENLKPLTVDIYDVDTWIKYGWGAIADPKFLSKLKDAPRLALTNKEIKPETPKKDAKKDDLIVSKTTFAQVRSYFTAVLDRARRFHEAMDAKTKTSPVQMYAYGGNCEQTLDAVVLIRDEKKNSWITLVDAKDIKTAAGLEIKKDDVKAAMFAIGDGRVTKRSLLAETQLSNDGGPDIENSIYASSFFACGSHTKLFLEGPIQDSFLSTLVVEKEIQP